MLTANIEDNRWHLLSIGDYVDVQVRCVPSFFEVDMHYSGSHGPVSWPITIPKQWRRRWDSSQFEGFVDDILGELCRRGNDDHRRQLAQYVSRIPGCKDGTAEQLVAHLVANAINRAYDEDRAKRNKSNDRSGQASGHKSSGLVRKILGLLK